jgi:tRNA (mo5U34)-methyltransferase
MSTQSPSPTCAPALEYEAIPNSRPDGAAMEARRSALQSRIEELGDWFHNIDLYGVPTAPRHFLGDYPRLKWQKIAGALPERLDGLSVLDIGCNAGFYSIEMKRRGAARVVGIDVDPRYLAQARFCASVLNLQIEFRQMSVYEAVTLREPFDYVLFMGLFYHLRYPLYALDALVKLVRHRLVFQTMIRGEEFHGSVESDYDFWNHAPFRQAGFPCLYFVEHRYAGDPTNWFIPNRAAVEGMLRSAGLRLVDHPESETWVCELDDEESMRGNFVFDRELKGLL